MFDYENPFMDAAQAAEEDLPVCDSAIMEEEPDWENAEWEKITDNHASTQEASRRAYAQLSSEATADRIYRKIRTKRRERAGIAAVRYAMLAIGFTAIGWLIRSIPGLAITLGVIALIFSLIAAYGAGKYREM